ncbi:MAG: Hsp20/alpha crystallin family protein [Rhodothermales bacterium]
MARLVRYAPAREMRTLQREIDRVFDGFFGNGNDENGGSTWTPRVDLAETENGYVIHLDVPGMSKEDLDINFHENVLTVRGERKAQETDEQHNYVRVERSHGSFFRSFTLPKAIKHDEIEANYQDGVLTIRVPKAEESKPRRIEVS